MSRFFNHLINAKAVSGFSSIGNLLLMLQINTAKHKHYSRGGTDEAARDRFYSSGHVNVMMHVRTVLLAV